MPLQPVAHVPEALDGEVLGVCGGRLWPVLTDPGEPLCLWMALGTCDASLIELDLSAVDALQELLADARARMAAG